jgi:S1-C subfamily serine protease
MSPKWYYMSGQQRRGPVSTAEFRQLAAAGNISPTDLVWTEGMPNWIKADSVKGLLPQAGNPGGSPPVPSAPTSGPHARVNSTPSVQGPVAGVKVPPPPFGPNSPMTPTPTGGVSRQHPPVTRSGGPVPMYPELTKPSVLPASGASKSASSRMNPASTGFGNSSSKVSNGTLATRPLWTHLLGEVRSIPVTTAVQTGRLCSYGFLVWRRRSLTKALRLAAVGDSMTSERLRKHDNQIELAKAALRSNGSSGWRRLFLGYGLIAVLLCSLFAALPKRRAITALVNQHEKPGAALISSERLVWTLEGGALKEAQMILDSQVASKQAKAGDSTIDADRRETDLRSLLRSHRSESTILTARSFVSACNNRSRKWLSETADKLGIRPEDLVVEWLTYEGALDLGMITRIWNEQGNFKGESAKIVASILNGVTETPALAKGVEIESANNERIVVKLFGVNVIEELVQDQPKSGEESPLVQWKSNYDYIRTILKGDSPKLVIDETLERDGDHYGVDYMDLFQEYWQGGHRQPWATRLVDASAIGVASSARDQRVLEGLGKQASSFARKSLKELFARLSPSVPLIESVDICTGSGFLVNVNGKMLVVTNRHVVEHASHGIAVHFLKSAGSGRQEERFTVAPNQTSVVAIHKTADLAAIDVSQCATALQERGVPAVQLADSSYTPEVGEHVFAIGHPGTGGGRLLTRTLSDGIVSAVGREYENSRFLQVTVPLNPGNSGGPLFDDEGRVVGVNTFIIRKNQTADLALEALNFTLQIEYVHELLTDKTKGLSPGDIALVLKPQEAPVEATNAFAEELKAKAGIAISKGFRPYGGDVDKSVKRLTVAAKRKTNLSFRCVDGETYLVLVVSRGSPDIDLAAVNASGTIVAADTQPDAEPVIEFTAKDSALYSLIVSNPSESNAVAVIAVFEK